MKLSRPPNFTSNFLVMSEPRPFEVSVEVEKWLSKIPVRAGKQPGFSCSPRYGVFEGDKLIEEFIGEHYSIAHTSSDAWASLHAVQVTIGTCSFWIAPDTLEKLRGKTLTVIQANVSRDQHAPKIRAFLVAA